MPENHQPEEQSTHLADQHEIIHIRGARVNNLKNIDIDIPKRRLTVFTGVSGSGKSSLVFGALAAESRRLFDETYSAFVQGFMPNLPRPDVDVMENLSPAIIIDQERLGAHAHSTVGTATDSYSLLRTLFAQYAQPHQGGAGIFSFNTPEGWCPTCEGQGKAASLDYKEIFDDSKSINEGAITAPGFDVGEWYWKTYAEAPELDPDIPISQYDEDQREFFLHAPQQKRKVDGSNVSYEGLITRIRRLWIDRAEPPKAKAIVQFVERIRTLSTCPECEGTRLGEAARSAKIEGKNIADCSAMQIDELREFLSAIPDNPVRDNLLRMLDSLVEVGLGYLSLNRPAGTLSGGEAQRVKMVRHLGSPLTDITYVFDEPTIGLHPHDIRRINQLLERIRDKGNTVVVVEHKPEVIAMADYIVDMGPASGSAGGEVVFAGSYEEFKNSDSLTAQWLDKPLSLSSADNKADNKADSAANDEGILVGPVTINNLDNVSVTLPPHKLSVITGVAGSGKSSLIHTGLAGKPGVLTVDQTPIRGSRRSSPATYTGLMDKIRSTFARSNKVKPALFSANSEGACPQCQGLGVIYIDLQIAAGVATTCEECQGKRFRPEVLDYKYKDHDISQVLDMSVVEAAEVFTTGEAAKILARLTEVGLGYLRLGQPLNTLSGGERQRIKLANQLDEDAEIIILDEPTAGLHLSDTDVIITMLRSIVARGKTVVVIEHNCAVMAAADWIVDIGPGAGHEGGTVVYEGTPSELIESDTLTAQYLKAAVAR